MLIEFIGSSIAMSHPQPTPMAKVIPEWWRQMPTTFDRKDINNVPTDSDTGGRINIEPDPHTIKKCIPVLDTLRTGYCIPMWRDLIVGLDENYHQILQWRELAGQLVADVRPWAGFVNTETGIGLPGTEDVGKPHGFILFNPWQIKTPPGYSCLFTPVLNSDIPLHFSSGIVNTDSYHNPVNFPFFVKENWSGTIKRGTPLIQVIPFKRDEWEHEIRIETSDDKNELDMVRGQIEGQYKEGYLEHHGCPVKHT
jgi:hypothetical protein